MTGEQQDHIQGINQRFTEFNHSKYTAGVKEHKNLLSSLPVTSLGVHALEEVADLVNYLYSLNDNLELIRTRLTALKESLTRISDDYFDADWKLVVYGHLTTPHPSVEELENHYDPIRRVEAIETILFGDSNG